MYKKKRKYLLFVILIVMLITYISFQFIKQPKYSQSSLLGKKNDYKAGTQTGELTAQQVVYDMGMGWNYGDYRTGFANEPGIYKNSYQVITSYASEPYTQWDAIGVGDDFRKIDGISGKKSVSWKIDSLSSTGPVGCFNIQLTNSQIKDSGITKVEYIIDNTKFSKLLSIIGNISIENVEKSALQIDDSFSNIDDGFLHKEIVSKVK